MTARSRLIFQFGQVFVTDTSLEKSIDILSSNQVQVISTLKMNKKR